MISPDQPMIEISANVLLKAYSCGIFPMAENADSAELHWIDPEFRGTLPLNDVNVPRRLAKTIRQQRFEVHIDRDFGGVIDGCAAPQPGRQATWINERIRSLYAELFELGYCHSVEIYRNGQLVGGLYGVALQGVFFGESMFSRERDASKVALAYLCARLIKGGFSLLDTQFITNHLAQFGAQEIARAQFQYRLTHALQRSADFMALDTQCGGGEILEIIRNHRGSA